MDSKQVKESLNQINLNQLTNIEQIFKQINCNLNIYINWDNEVKLLFLTKLKENLINETIVTKLVNNKELNTLSQLSNLNKENLIPDLPIPIINLALKSLCNCLFLSSNLRSIYTTLPYISTITQRIKKFKELNKDTLFLYFRILFLSTLDNSKSINELIEDKQFVKALEEIIITLDINQVNSSFEYNNNLILTDLLKLIFNLINHYEAQEKIASLFNDIFNILLKSLIIIKEFNSLSSPYYQILTILIHYPIASYTDSNYCINEYNNLINNLLRPLIQLCDKGNYNEYENEYEQLSPNIILIINILKVKKELIEIYANKLLPDEKEHELPLGQSETGVSRLINVLTASNIRPFKQLLAEFYFVICNEDASKMILKLGYGNVAGYLMGKGIDINNVMTINTDATNPPNPVSTSTSTSTNKPINPITGQFKQNESKGKIHMTDEEKEIEAERLFILFEKIKKNPAIKLQNPIQQAVELGIYDEIKVDEEDSD
ncbi:hypothetical protein K502DRAFT_348443 [Neoconidiobolus thromboides FSU 785]|nr:hypothetical protein K502DRAFT_348443 [Neoconidiobolus thromboides FSU 785]